MRDPQYIVARAVLLDALEALGDQRDAIIVVGAQAIYLHTGTIELAVPEFTIDADLTIDPSLLRDVPEIESALRAARFARGNRVGAWVIQRDVAGVAMTVEVDLMVPEAVGGPGRRAARLPGHAKDVARKARGLEAALVDKMTMTISALDPADRRWFDVAVAGRMALLIAKLHKVAERVTERDQRRLDDKDALDILRLLQATDTLVLAATVTRLLETDVARAVTREALAVLKDHFTDARAAGPQMAGRAAGVLMPADEVAHRCFATHSAPSSSRSRGEAPRLRHQPRLTSRSKRPGDRLVDGTRLAVTAKIVENPWPTWIAKLIGIASMRRKPLKRSAGTRLSPRLRFGCSTTPGLRPRHESLTSEAGIPASSISSSLAVWIVSPCSTCRVWPSSAHGRDWGARRRAFDGSRPMSPTAGPCLRWTFGTIAPFFTSSPRPLTARTTSSG